MLIEVRDAGKKKRRQKERSSPSRLQEYYDPRTIIETHDVYMAYICLLIKRYLNEGLMRERYNSGDVPRYFKENHER